MKAETLEQLRKKSKLKPTETAEKLGITYPYLYSLEKGIKNPSDQLKVKLCNLYNVDMNTLFLALNFTKRK